MLTREDLEQIAHIFDTSFDAVDKRLDNLEKRFDKVDQRLDGIEKRLDAFEIRLDKLEQAIIRVDNKLDKAQEDISVILSEVLEHHDKLEKRVDRIEDHLHLPKLQ